MRTSVAHQIEIASINVSERKGTTKTPKSQVALDERGIVGDAHAGVWHRQLSLLAQEKIERFEREYDQDLAPGDFGENLTVTGLAEDQLRILDRLQFGQALIEITQKGKRCHGKGCAIYNRVGTCVMPTEGYFARVVSGGTLRRGERGVHLPKTLRARIITLSDRAYQGEYADQSGPLAVELFEAAFAGRPWRISTETTIIPDDAAALTAAICDEPADIIFTTGGTGIGPRDITPETVAPLLDKEIPGIFEAIRIKYGMEKPNALLSRGVAGVRGQTLIYTLPGSVKAVREYMTEIVKTLEHLLLMLHGINAH